MSAAAAGSALFLAVRCGGFPERPFDRALARFWMGLVALASIQLGLSLFVPLNSPVAVLLVLAPIGFALLRRVRHDLRTSIPSRAELRLLAVFLLAASVNGSSVVLLHDTGLYHYPLIRWLGEFGLAPGLAHMHYRFSFSSSWFGLGAALEPAILQGRMTAALNGLLIATGMTHVVVTARRILTAQALPADWYAVGAYPFFFYVTFAYRMSISASPNVPAAAAALLCGWIFMQRNAADSRAIQLVAIAAALAVKITLLPAVGLTALANLAVRRFDGLWVGLPVACVLALPLPVANYIASGCPLFPSSLLCSSEPHSLSPDEADAHAAVNRKWARYGRTHPESAPFWRFDWIWKWLERPRVVFSTIFFVASLGVAVRFRAGTWPFWISLSGTGFVVLLMPDIRFNYGYVAMMPGIAVAALVSKFRSARPPAWLRSIRDPILAAPAVAILLANAYVQDHVIQTRTEHDRGGPFVERLVVPPPLIKPTARKSEGPGFTYNMPASGDVCWAIEIPCTPYPMRSDVGLCDPARGLAGGFCRTDITAD